MDKFIKKIDIRWADLDPNFHVLHSKYYDFGAYCRMDFMERHGLTMAFMQQNNIGPIIFREECVFRKEVRFGDDVMIDLETVTARKDFSRWSLRHHITANGSLAAIINLDGAWLDTVKRKLALPSPEIIAIFDQIPKPEGFVTLP